MKTREVAEFLSAELEGDGELQLTGIASLSTAGPCELSFVDKAELPVTQAGALIVGLDIEPVKGVPALIWVEHPKLAFARASQLFEPRDLPGSWDATALIAADANVRALYIGPHVSIGAGSTVGEACKIHAGTRIGMGVSVGESTVIHSNVTICDRASIGSNCVIQAGSVIGSAGFGYVTDPNGSHIQFPQIGSVVIGDEVEVGANCTIDGGSLGTTEIGRGTKIDNLVHIAHNVRIGERVLIAGQSGIAGSSVIEDDVVIAGQVGISDHVLIRRGAIIGAKSAVYPNKIVSKGMWVGNPARPLRDFLRDKALRRELEALRREVEALRSGMRD